MHHQAADALYNLKHVAFFYEYAVVLDWKYDVFCFEVATEWILLIANYCKYY